ncbi:amino acid transporter antl1-like isoform x2 [Plakobranchus ocellatus]|uniref:Amino acid transporter antl1-like isoform x2 n=1 Tax=Plakobranchus ocellatus TaxID=259542 RepID=A0AAV4AS64_9GAST|nr:amino acid transporter antl1-like isoform x2 [Plakobranchus ocellatus]
MFVCACTATYTGTLLGRCWLLVRERHVEYRENTRHPYPAIGQAAFGKNCRKLVSFCVDFTSFGSCVVFVLLASQNISDLVASIGPSWSFCSWLVIVAAALCPFCWLGTPKDFWPIALAAALATAVACLVILIKMWRDAVVVLPAFHGPLYWKSFLISFGTMAFAFGGHHVFPTIQVDMKKPERFSAAISIAYLGILALYVPVSVVGYLVYGSNLKANVLMAMLPGPLLTIAQLLITVHLLTATIILINPVCQEGEDVLKIPPNFSFRRIVYRTIVMGLIMFTALSLPQFGAVLALVGGSSMTAMVFIFPPLFYLRLCSMKGSWDLVEVSLHEKVACVEIIIVGALMGSAATYTALDALLSSQFSKPCYIN